MKDQFNEIIKSEELKYITIDHVEKILDSQITNEVLQEIPILKSLVAIKKIYSSYSDQIFTKKAMKVLLELSDTNWKERVELTSSLDDEDSLGAEKILMAIDNLETIKKCKVYGRLCRLRALDEIDVDSFLRLTKVIQNAYLEDLEYIKDFEPHKGKETSLEEYISILALGLIYQENSEQTEIVKNTRRNSEYEPEYIGGEIQTLYYLSYTGEILLKYYKELFQAK